MVETPGSDLEMQGRERGFILAVVLQAWSFGFHFRILIMSLQPTRNQDFIFLSCSHL